MEVKDYPLVRVTKETITAKWTGHGDQVVATRFGQGSETRRSLGTEEDRMTGKGLSTTHNLIDPFFCNNGRCDSFYACRALLSSDNILKSLLQGLTILYSRSQRDPSLVISSGHPPLFPEAIRHMTVTP